MSETVGELANGQHQDLTSHGHELLNPALADEDFAAAVRIAQAEFDQACTGHGVATWATKRHAVTGWGHDPDGDADSQPTSADEPRELTYVDLDTFQAAF